MCRFFYLSGSEAFHYHTYPNCKIEDAGTGGIMGTCQIKYVGYVSPIIRNVVKLEISLSIVSP